MKIEKGLLMHWWHYYGKCIYTLEELEEFEKIIDKYGIDKVLDVAVSSFICSDGSPTIILKSIRTDTVEKIFDALSEIESMNEKEKQEYNIIKEEFVKIISETYK